MEADTGHRSDKRYFRCATVLGYGNRGFAQLWLERYLPSGHGDASSKARLNVVRAKEEVDASVVDESKNGHLKKNISRNHGRDTKPYPSHYKVSSVTQSPIWAYAAKKIALLPIFPMALMQRGKSEYMRTSYLYLHNIQTLHDEYDLYV